MNKGGNPLSSRLIRVNEDLPGGAPAFTKGLTIPREILNLPEFPLSSTPRHVSSVVPALAPA